MKKRTKDRIQDGLIMAVALGVLAWAGTTLLEADKTPDKIENLQEKVDENRESVQGLIDLHLKK